MKAYGMPRVADLESPDVADIRCLALKSSTGRFKEKGGDYRGYIKNKKAKAAIRRSMKKVERRAAKEAIRYDN